MSPPQEVAPFLQDAVQLDAFVAQWVAGTLPKTAWTHAAHVAVCAYYAWPDAPTDVLCARMRTGIRAYNDAVGTPNTATSGYHETLTRLWAGLVVDLLRRSPAATRLAAVRVAVEALGTARSLASEYYSFDVVRSTQARAAWVPPDLKPTPGEPTQNNRS